MSQYTDALNAWLSANPTAGQTIKDRWAAWRNTADDPTDWAGGVASRIDTPWGRLGGRQTFLGGDTGEPLPEQWMFELENSNGNGGTWVTPISMQANGQLSVAGDPYFRGDESLMDSLTPFMMVAAPFASAIGATMAGAGAAGAAGSGVAAAGGAEAGAGIAGGSGLSLGGTGAMTAGEALGAAGGSGLSLGGSSLGTSLGAAGGSGLSLGGVTAGTTSALGGTLGASLSGLGDSTLSDSILNGATSGGTGGVGANLPSTPSTGGLSSSDSAVLHSNEGYGPGMTGAQNSAYNSVLDTTGSTSLAAAAADPIGALGNAGTLINNTALGDAASWLRSNPTLGRLLFSGATSLLSAAGNSGGGGGSGGASAPETYGAPKQWTSALQRGLYQQPEQVSLPTTLAGQLGINGASRWVR